jgi:hypothetical protein
VRKRQRSAKIKEILAGFSRDAGMKKRENLQKIIMSKASILFLYFYL